MYRVILTRRAQKEYESLSAADLVKIDASLDNLKAEPQPHGVKKLYGNIHRIRVGDWRIIYAVFDKDKIVLAGKIARRSKTTYDGVDGLF